MGSGSLPESSLTAPLQLTLLTVHQARSGVRHPSPASRAAPTPLPRLSLSPGLCDCCLKASVSLGSGNIGCVSGLRASSRRRRWWRTECTNLARVREADLGYGLTRVSPEGVSKF